MYLFCAKTCFSVLRSFCPIVRHFGIALRGSDNTLRKAFPFGFAKCFNVPDSRKNRAVIPLSPALYHIDYGMSRVFAIIFSKKRSKFCKIFITSPKSSRQGEKSRRAITRLYKKIRLWAERRKYRFFAYFSRKIGVFYEPF